MSTENDQSRRGFIKAVTVGAGVVALGAGLGTTEAEATTKPGTPVRQVLEELVPFISGKCLLRQGQMILGLSRRAGRPWEFPGKSVPLKCLR